MGQQIEMDLDSQTKAIREHLLSGKSITPLEALKLYGCLRLGARIWDLRNKEHLAVADRWEGEGRKAYKAYFIPKRTKKVNHEEREHCNHS